MPSFQAHALGIQQGRSEENSQELCYESRGRKPVEGCIGSGPDLVANSATAGFVADSLLHFLFSWCS